MSKVPFQDALDLVRTRKVYLLAGNAYIPHYEIVTIVLNDFRTRLSKALAVSNTIWSPFTKQSVTTTRGSFVSGEMDVVNFEGRHY